MAERRISDAEFDAKIDALKKENPDLEVPEWLTVPTDKAEAYLAELVEATTQREPSQPDSTWVPLPDEAYRINQYPNKPGEVQALRLKEEAEALSRLSLSGTDLGVSSGSIENQALKTLDSVIQKPGVKPSAVIAAKTIKHFIQNK